MIRRSYLARSPLEAYGAAVLATAAAVAVRGLLEPFLGATAVFLQFFPAVMFSAWYGGMGAGVFATALAALATAWIYLPPLGSFYIAGIGDRAGVLLFLGVGVLISALNEKLHRARWRVELDAEALRQREAAVRHSEARKTAMLDMAFDAIVAMDARGYVQEWNPAAERMFGYRRQQAIGQELASLIIPERLQQCHRDGLARHLAHGIGTFLNRRLEVPAMRAGGSEFKAELAVTRISQSAEPFFEATIRDITDRLQAEAALSESQSLFREFMDHSPALAFIRDPEGRLVYVNAAYEQFFRMSSAELLGTSLGGVVPDETAARLRLLYDRVLAENRPLHEPVVIPDPDGTDHPCMFYLFPVAERAGQRLLGGMALDMSEQHLLEARLRQAQKMEAVGRLAGGIAHDFNNMLAVINGYSELLLRDPALTPRTVTQIAAVREAGERAARLTRQLLAFSRQQVLAPEVLDLDATIYELSGMLQRLIGEDIDVTIRRDPDLGSVRADPGQMEQVLLNLAVNARDAMPQGGRLTIATENVDVDPTQTLLTAGIQPGRYVVLSLTDTGHGMPPAVQQRIFDPFFTTKEVGKGTGLGLSTVLGIVEQSGGHIAVESEVGRGTTFRIYLPRVDLTVGTAPSGEPAPEVPTGRETVLLAEDDRGVRGMVRELLREKGFTVLVAESAAEALELCREHDAEIHLLLTDVVLPGMSGRELATRVKARFPECRVLFMSGYTDDGVMRAGVLAADVDLIQKPFATAALVRKVREILDRQPSERCSRGTDPGASTGALADRGD